ncbi:uncharacterized protein BO66DRAFT_78318 [Aspergillus aculeatinus CBS 121060]|uniref:Uncharacterized protein n=1 Tax=Aspergillus aculeatinus CBS 121060 TaxID=1448322 RepID=A0ACD1HAT8_9EURO|nr:hypothetical protein BO66DRAFT_78318 [Aspergillus aculeatinus CBS 121060]RAH70697.1 hypothetical protein BO66DRAFT_78318 [Aspergillus aculeatinus CBS 121060]
MDRKSHFPLSHRFLVDAIPKHHTTFFFFFFSYFWLQCFHFLGLSVNNNIIWSIIPTPVPLPPPSNGCVIVIIGIVSCPHSMAHVLGDPPYARSQRGVF